MTDSPPSLLGIQLAVKFYWIFFVRQLSADGVYMSRRNWSCDSEYSIFLMKRRVKGFRLWNLWSLWIFKRADGMQKYIYLRANIGLSREPNVAESNLIRPKIEVTQERDYFAAFYRREFAIKALDAGSRDKILISQQEWCYINSHPSKWEDPPKALHDVGARKLMIKTRKWESRSQFFRGLNQTKKKLFYVTFLLHRVFLHLAFRIVNLNKSGWEESARRRNNNN